MSSDYSEYSDYDDGRVIADMSSVERQPMLVPRPGAWKRGGSGGRGIQGADVPADQARGGSENDLQLEPEERRAFIKGAVVAGLLVTGVIGAAFALLILLMSGRIF